LYLSHHARSAARGGSPQSQAKPDLPSAAGAKIERATPVYLSHHALSASQELSPQSQPKPELRSAAGVSGIQRAQPFDLL